MPKIRPVIVDPQRKGAARQRRSLAQVLRHIEGPGLVPQVNDDAALVSALRLGQLHFRAGAAAFPDPGDLFLRRFGEGEHRFFDFDFVGGRGGGGLGASALRSGGRGGAALQLDVRQAHVEGAVLRIVRQEPALELLAHHRGRDGEMHRGRAAFRERLWIQFAINGRRIIDDAEPRAAGEHAESHGFSALGGR